MPLPENSAKPHLPANVRQIFIDAGKQFPGDFARQAQHIVDAHRPAGLVKNSPPLNMDLSDWERIQRKKESEMDRQRLEAEAQAREHQRQAELVEQKRRLAETAQWQLHEQKRIQERLIGEQTCQELEQEIRNTAIPQIAEQIANSWRQGRRGSISVSPYRGNKYGWPDVVLKDDGTIGQNHSQVGIEIIHSVSYETTGYSDVGYSDDNGDSGSKAYTYTKTETNSLRLGIGFFPPEDVIPEARDLAKANADPQKGVKAYYLSSSQLYTNSCIVPTNFPGASDKFLEHLYELERRFRSDIVRLNPPPAQTRPTETQSGTQKRGFFRRLFSR